MAVDENDFYRQASIHICGNLEIEKAMWQCLQYVRQFLPATELMILLTEHDLGALRLIARARVEGGEKLNIIIPLPPEARAALKGAALPDVRIVNDPETDLVTRPSAKFLGLSNVSSMIMFLVTAGQRLGSAAAVLLVEGRHQYTPDHLRLFSSLNEPFVIALSNYLSHMEVMRLKERLADDNRYLSQELQRRSAVGIVGGDFGLRPVMEKVRQVAQKMSTVLLLGETGVGKEVVADAIHRYSSRSSGPYIKVNCGAISPTILDSELFGHEKGAFTGAITVKRGRFERAHKGTIFLDEIGELTPEAQQRLLRVLQYKEVERVGGSRLIPVDIRVIAATNRNLESLVASKQFRKDLWFRLNVFPIVIPPLRERAEDIPALVNFFLEKKASDLSLNFLPRLAPGAIERLTRYPWPGNVRELENVVERALLLCNGNPLRFRELEATDLDGEPSFLWPAPRKDLLTLDQVNARHIREVLKMTKGKINGPTGCAAILGIKPNTLRCRMEKLEVPYGKNRLG